MKYLLILEEYKESLEYLLRKHPKYIPLFKQFNNEPFERLRNLYNKLNTYRELYDFNQISNLTTYEQVDDFISKLVIDKQKKDYVYQFISNKYKHLINEQTIELFDQIRKVIGNDREKINDLIIKKLAIYKNTADLNKDLNTILINLTGEFNVDSIIKKYNGLDIAFKDERVVIYDIHSYAQMKKIDNSKWCIVRDKDSFHYYYIKGLTKQYVIFDTSKNVTNPLHMIGLTINPNGSINACHDYNDNNLNLKSRIKDMDIYVLYNQYLKPEDDNTVNIYANEYIGYDIEKILRYGLIDYFLKGVGSGYLNPSVGDNFAITCAAENGYLDLVKYLMSLPKEYGIDPSAEDNYAIRLASENGHLDIVKYLIGLPKEYGIDPSADDNYSIRMSAENGHLDVVKYLISLPKEYGIDPSAKDSFTIRWAAGNGYLDVVKYLISLPKEYGIDPSAKDSFTIRWTAASGYLDVVKYLISLPKEYGIDPSADNNIAIKWAALGGHLDIVKYLISLPKEYGIDPSANNNIAIIWALEKGNLDVVKYLLSLDKVKDTLSKEDYQKYTDMILKSKV